MCHSEEGWLQRLRYSKVLVVVVVFLSLFTDSLLLTLIDPILPDILGRVDNITLDSGNTDLINSNGRYGFMVAAKGAAQFICNPAVGLIVSRFGYRGPMLVGDVVLMVSAIAFAYGRNYGELFATRVFQGISSAVTAVTGMGLLAATYTDDNKRGRVMGVAIGGLSLGIIAGPVYGSILYEFVGRTVPFLILGVMIFLALVLQTLTFQRDSGFQKDHSMTAICRLLADPYILIVAGNIFLLNLDVSVILAFLPLELISLENPPPWKLGIVVLPTSVGYLIASVIFPRVTNVIPRYLCAMLGLLVSSGTLVGLAFCNTFTLMLVVTTFLGLALGMVSTAMQPVFAQLVDMRHSTIYGNVYAISDMAVCLAMTIGPLVGGLVIYTFNFAWLVCGVAVLNLSFALCSLLLRNPPARLADKGDKGAKLKASIDSAVWLENEPLMSKRDRRRNSQDTTRSCPTMDLSRVPSPRYIGCLTGVEDFYSDSEIFINYR